MTQSYNDALTGIKSAFMRATAMGDESIVTKAIEEAEKQWREASKEEFNYLYAEEIKEGEFSGTKYTALFMLHNLKRRQVDSEIKAVSELRDLYEVFTRGLFGAAGYETMIEYLKAGDIKVTGPTSDYLGIAQEIIPWCMSRKLIVAGIPVDINWFSRFIGSGAKRKCIASRTRKAMKLMREVIASESLPMDEKDQSITMILNVINNPVHSLAELELRFKAQYTEDTIYATYTPDHDGAGVLILNIGNQNQFKAIKGRLRGFVEIS